MLGTVEQEWKECLKKRSLDSRRHKRANPSSDEAKSPLEARTQREKLGILFSGIFSDDFIGSGNCQIAVSSDVFLISVTEFSSDLGKAQRNPLAFTIPVDLFLLKFI